jgi:hypothetical protein
MAEEAEIPPSRPHKTSKIEFIRVPVTHIPPQRYIPQYKQVDRKEQFKVWQRNNQLLFG